MNLDYTLLRKYRTELMGIGALLILICNMPESVLKMPHYLGHLLSIGNIGVIFIPFY